LRRSEELKRKASRWRHDEQAVQEVEVNTFIALHDGFDPEFVGDRRATVRTWLFCTLRNKLGDALRARGRIPDLLEFNAEHEEEGLYQTRTHDNAAELEGVDWVDNVLAHLSPADRELIELKELENWDAEELSIYYGCPGATIRQRLLRARRRLAEVYRLHPELWRGK
jgi:RNA polymerase sigma factor (sigma-70 family)